VKEPSDDDFDDDEFGDGHDEVDDDAEGLEIDALGRGHGGEPDEDSCRDDAAESDGADADDDEDSGGD
jgi:hypothetical protein